MNNKRKLYLTIFGLPFMTLLYIYIVLNMLLDYAFRLEYDTNHYAKKVSNYFIKYYREIDYFNLFFWFMVLLYLVTILIQ